MAIIVATRVCVCVCVCACVCACVCVCVCASVTSLNDSCCHVYKYRTIPVTLSYVVVYVPSGHCKYKVLCIVGDMLVVSH